MKFTAEKKFLLHALERCKSVTDSKAPMPILAHVLIDAVTDELVSGAINFSATDLFVSVRTDIPAEVDDDGAGKITLNAKELYDRVKLMPDGNIKFTLKDTAVTLKAAGSPRRFVMQGLPADEFPKLPEYNRNNDTPDLVLKALELSSAIDRTIYSVSLDETRLHLNSLLIERHNNDVRFVSTDGHRLSLLNTDTVTPTVNTEQWLIPLKAVREIGKLCAECAANKNAKQEVLIDRDGSNLFVSVNDFTFCTKLVDAQFPPYQQVIPTDSKNKVDLPRKQLLDALKALTVATGDSKGIKFTFNQNKLVLSAKSVTGGDGEDELDCVYTGPEFTFGLSAVYISDALKAIGSDTVTFKISDELDPCVVVPKDSDTYLSVVMPMRV